MLKKTLYVLAVLLVPALVLAADETIDSDTFQAIKSLADAKVVTIQIYKDKLTRQEAVTYINNAVTNLLGDTTGDLATNENINKVFDLVKEFQTDMMESGQKLSAIEQTLIDLKLKEEQNKEILLKEKHDKLLSETGLRIYGEAAAYMTDLLLYGQAGTTPERFRPLTQYIDLDFNMRAVKGLSMDAILRLENVFGGFWGTEDIYGVRRLSIDGNYKISFSVGDYQAKLTPYTIWAVDDDRPFESKIFSDKRDMNKEELFLTDNSWPVTGAKANTTINLFGPDVSFEVMIARLEAANRSSYYIIPNLDQTATTLFTYPHDQYMGAARIDSEILKDILKLGVNFVEIKDVQDTGVYGNPVLDNYVGSVDGEIKIMGLAKVKGEFAMSDYYSGSDSGQSWQNKYISDTAFRIKGEAENSSSKLEADFFVNGNSFTAYAAQTRMYDESNNYPYLTQNNTWNVSLTPTAYPLYSVGSIVYPFTKYNPSIVASYYPIGANLMPYTFYENNSMPYGDATPNRQGVTIKFSGDYLGDIFMPYVRYSNIQEIVSYLPGDSAFFARTFSTVEAGIKLKSGDFILSGGYKNEYTYNNAPAGSDVNLTSGITDLGIEYRPDKKWVFAAGCKDIVFSGFEYPYTFMGSGWGYEPRQDFNNSVLSYGVSIDYQVTSFALTGISYTDTVIKDNTDEAFDYSAQEIDAKLTMKF